MKKVISLFILMTLAFSTTLSFGNLSQPSNWATNGIAYMIKEGCVPTHLQGDYSKPITRLEFTQLMIQTIEGITPDKSSIPEVSTPFKDTKDSAVRKAYAYDLIGGTSATTFSPDNLITREQIAIMLINTAGTANNLSLDGLKYAIFVNEPVSFNDKQLISSWAKDYVAISVTGKLMNGNPDNTFNPKGNATREQAIMMLYNIVSRKDVNANVLSDLRKQYAGKYFSNSSAIPSYLAGDKAMNFELLSFKGKTKTDFEKMFNEEYTMFNYYRHNSQGFFVAFENNIVSFMEISYFGDAFPYVWTVNGASDYPTYNEIKDLPGNDEIQTYYWGIKVQVKELIIDECTVRYAYDLNKLDSKPVFIKVIF